jgi:molybdopterin-guanine dinucleotide biosynthesis protein B
MSRRLLGAILAGGEGRRIGGPKEEVPFQGRPLLAHPWNALAPVTGGSMLLQGADRAPEGMEASPDGRPGEGPLGGIETLLQRARNEGRPGVVMAPVDLPRVPASLVIGIVRRWREFADREDRAVLVWDGERLQPLLGVYGVGLAPGLTRWLDGGLVRAVHAWVDTLGSRVQRLHPNDVPGTVGHARPLLNVNRPEDLRGAGDLPFAAPPLVAVLGWKDSGKTTTASALVRALRGRGWRVMVLKHGHGFRLDAEGTDSSRLRDAGAERVLLAGPEGMGLLGGWREGSQEPEVVELAARYLGEADVVVAEGWKGAPLPAIEVVKHPKGDDPPLWSPASPDRDRFLARVVPRGVVEDRDEGDHPPAFDRDSPDLGDRLADVVESRVIPGWRP